MAKYRAVLQYAGGRYSGWQVQKDRDTVQGALNQALRRITGLEKVSWVGAGRTDAGVHAMGQCAHFRLPEAAQAEGLQRALNGVLPWDIRVQKLSRVQDAFHARRDALKKLYEYRIHHGPVLPPFRHGWVYHSYYRLDPERFRQGADLLRGTWDFSGFAASSSSVKTHVRTVFESRLRRQGSLLRYQIEADGFLQHMVRNIVGTLLEIARGRRAPEDVLRILASRDRRNAGPTAQPQGLYLIKVFYPASS
ncbi:MAG TPA: tRNA pseudouridine(38-40) synthase TruA [Acidobacteriota bacterium]|nr:tRNA pseudouridine(38-40) synthase TruA [Acidobacteriota bacterium]